MHPVGPLPASTYWRRRAALALGLLVGLLLLRSCTGGGSAPGKHVSTKPSATPSATSRASAGPSATKAPVTTAAGTCPDSALRLVVKPDLSTYPVGTNPSFTLTVTNTSATACKRDLGAKAVSLTVVSGTARTWNSDDCSNGTDSALTTLAPNKEVLVVDYHWNGLRSLPGCPAPRAQATAGTYQVSGTVGTLTSARVVFHFR
ncbi:MAG: hypothetical protein JWO22_1867 [Frankiales bacterium]|nr:hypothetical protein [Frankiales bacterium]